MASTIIREGSKIIIFDKSFSMRHEDIETSKDIEVSDNMLMLLDGYLCCTNSYNAVEKIDENTFQINVYAQDALVVKEDVLYESIQDAD